MDSNQTDWIRAAMQRTNLVLAVGLALAASPAAAGTIVYDSFDTPAYSLAGYGAQMGQPLRPG